MGREGWGFVHALSDVELQFTLRMCVEAVSAAAGQFEDVAACSRQRPLSGRLK